MKIGGARNKVMARESTVEVREKQETGTKTKKTAGEVKVEAYNETRRE